MAFDRQKFRLGHLRDDLSGSLDTSSHHRPLSDMDPLDFDDSLSQAGGMSANYRQREMGVPFSPGDGTSSLVGRNGVSSRFLVKQDRMLSPLEGQRLPLEMAWFRDFQNKRRPDDTFVKSFQDGNVLPEVSRDGPRISVGITLLSGSDIMAVNDAEFKRLQKDSTTQRCAGRDYSRAEIRRLQQESSPQKSPEWKVYTAAALLQRIHVDQYLRTSLQDDSTGIVDKYRRRHGQIADTGYTSIVTIGSRQRTQEGISSAGDHPGVRSNTVVLRSPTAVGFHQNSDAVSSAGRTAILTISSDNVEILLDQPSPNHQFDIVSTLIEVDHFSLRDLMQNYQTIIQSTGRAISTQDILKILDTMINDVRRLCARSPRLFRVPTRSLIAQSIDTRYGIDEEGAFFAFTTSEGIRQIIEKSISYFAALNDSRTEQDRIRPKFLQMVVLLVALLNESDLIKVRKIIESTFNIPGNRPDLELLICKVLPLGAANEQIFIESLYEAYSPETKGHSYDKPELAPAWEALQLELARRGYMVPHHVPDVQGPSGDVEEAEDLEALLDSDPDQKLEDTTPEPRTWMIPWPSRGITSSTIFKYLQHDEKVRDFGNANQSSIKGINEIPHLEIAAEDREHHVEVWLTDNCKYMVASHEPEPISAMEVTEEGDDYMLKKIEDGSNWALEIRETPVNQVFIEAVVNHNTLVQNVQGFLSSQKNSRFTSQLPFKSNRGVPSADTFKQVDVPVMARKVWADVVPHYTAANGLSFAAERTRVAVVFKVGSRIVLSDDIVREMKRSLGKLRGSAEKLEEVAKAKPPGKLAKNEAERQLQKLFEDCMNMLVALKEDIAKAEQTLEGQMNESADLPSDPICKVVLPSMSMENRPLWQKYQVSLSRDEQYLIVRCKVLTIEAVGTVQPGDTDVDVTLRGCNFSLKIQSLVVASQLEKDGGFWNIHPGAVLMWMGYYVAVAESKKADMESKKTARRAYGLLGYYRVIGHTDGAGSPGGVRVRNLGDMAVRII